MKRKNRDVFESFRETKQDAELQLFVVQSSHVEAMLMSYSKRLVPDGIVRSALVIPKL